MAQHAPLVALDCALLGTICVNHQPRSPSFQFARATDHENDQMVRIRTRRELVDMGRVLVRPEQQRTPTRFPTAGCHLSWQVLVRVQAGNGDGHGPALLAGAVKRSNCRTSDPVSGSHCFYAERRRFPQSRHVKFTSVAICARQHHMGKGRRLPCALPHGVGPTRRARK
jgi:hypothetical protein